MKNSWLVLEVTAAVRAAGEGAGPGNKEGGLSMGGRLSIEARDGKGLVAMESRRTAG
jgi:hypothetical protein